MWWTCTAFWIGSPGTPRTLYGEGVDSPTGALRPDPAGSTRCGVIGPRKCAQGRLVATSSRKWRRRRAGSINGRGPRRRRRRPKVPNCCVRCAPVVQYWFNRWRSRRAISGYRPLIILELKSKDESLGAAAGIFRAKIDRKKALEEKRLPVWKSTSVSGALTLVPSSQ